jgi:hypothetical protein
VLDKMIESYKALLDTHKKDIFKIVGGGNGDFMSHRQNIKNLNEFINLANDIQLLAHYIDEHKGFLTSYIKTLKEYLLLIIEYNEYLTQKNKIFTNLNSIDPKYNYNYVLEKYNTFKEKQDKMRLGDPQKLNETIMTIIEKTFLNLKMEIDHYNKDTYKDNIVIIVDFGKKYTIIQLIFMLSMINK